MKKSFDSVKIEEENSSNSNSEQISFSYRKEDWEEEPEVGNERCLVEKSLNFEKNGERRT